jgi:hypothetical protein
MRKHRKIPQAKINILKYSRQEREALLISTKEEQLLSFQASLRVRLSLAFNITNRPKK